MNKKSTRVRKTGGMESRKTDNDIWRNSKKFSTNLSASSIEKLCDKCLKKLDEQKVT